MNHSTCSSLSLGKGTAKFLGCVSGNHTRKLAWRSSGTPGLKAKHHVKEDVEKAKLIHTVSRMYPPLTGKRVDFTYSLARTVLSRVPNMFPAWKPAAKRPKPLIARTLPQRSSSQGARCGAMADARGGFHGFCGETRCPPTTVQL